MKIQWAPATDLGLQHVLENGVAILRGTKFPPGRGQEVLSNLVQIFSEANRGSEALNHSLTQAAEEQPALEIYSIFYRYLKDSFGEEVPQRLEETRALLEAMEGGTEAPPEKRLAAEQILESLLSALARERAVTSLRPQRNFYYN